MLYVMCIIYLVSSFDECHENCDVVNERETTIVSQKKRKTVR